MVGVNALLIGIGVWVAPAVLVLVAIAVVETCSWFGRRVRGARPASPEAPRARVDI
jgi:hypothetical protein